jgi:putative methyltransferase (TIGR04325 family)
MGLIRRIKKKISSKLNRKIFSSYEEALKYCESKTRGAYQSQNLTEYRFKKTHNFLINNGNIITAPSMPLLMFAINFYLKKDNSRIPKIVDFGGACGESLILLQKIFSDKIYKSSWIIESPQIVSESRKWEFAKKIQFSSNLKNIISNNKIDIFFTSGCIHYLKNPYEVINTVAESNISLVVFTRNNFSSKTEIKAQISYLSENGIGSHLKEFEDKLVYYPITSILPKKVIDIFIRKGYSILIDFKKGKEENISGIDGDLIFYKS